MGLDALIERMEADLAGLPPDDGRRHFHATYLRTTRAVADEIHGGGFEDADWRLSTQRLVDLTRLGFGVLLPEPEKSRR